MGASRGPEMRDSEVIPRPARSPPPPYTFPSSIGTGYRPSSFYTTLLPIS